MIVDWLIGIVSLLCLAYVGLLMVGDTDKTPVVKFSEGKPVITDKSRPLTDREKRYRFFWILLGFAFISVLSLARLLKDLT